MSGDELGKICILKFMVFFVGFYFQRFLRFRSVKLFVHCILWYRSIPFQREVLEFDAFLQEVLVFAFFHD